MVLDLFGAHGLERAVADVERDLRDADALLSKRVEQLRREVKAGRWRRDGSARACIDGLIAFAVRRPVVSFDVGWQRDVTDAVDRRLNRRSVIGPETDGSAAIEATGLDLAAQRHAST